MLLADLVWGLHQRYVQARNLVCLEWSAVLPGELCVQFSRLCDYPCQLPLDLCGPYLRGLRGEIWLPVDWILLLRLHCSVHGYFLRATTVPVSGLLHVPFSDQLHHLFGCFWVHLEWGIVLFQQHTVRPKIEQLRVDLRCATALQWTRLHELRGCCELSLVVVFFMLLQHDSVH